MPCFIDKDNSGEIYNNCCLDYHEPEDCSIAKKLHKQKKTKNECEYWREPQLSIVNQLQQLLLSWEKRANQNGKKEYVRSTCDCINDIHTIINQRKIK